MGDDSALLGGKEEKGNLGDDSALVDVAYLAGKESLTFLIELRAL